MPRSVIRPATVADLPALLGLEERCFDSDRISPRQFRYLLTRAQAATLVSEADGRLEGYVLMLFSRATSTARLFSVAVDADCRGRHVGRRLVLAGERSAIEHEKAYVRLEIRIDNLASQRLFESLGYERFAVEPDYYEDHEPALRYEKFLASHRRPERDRIPFYEQTLDFTCGPASLMMAMKALRPELTLERSMELRIWRESTTIFMSSGFGGSSPHGLALAAHQRGFGAEVYVNEEGPPLLRSVRSPAKREVMALVHAEMEAEAEAAGIPVRHRTLSVEELEERFEAGDVPLVLISSWRIYGDKIPHWVVVTGFDRLFVYANDPYVDREEDESVLDSIHMPIVKREFSRMARYGRSGLQAVVLVRERTDG